MARHGLAMPGVTLGRAGFGGWSRLMVRDGIATAAHACAMEGLAMESCKRDLHWSGGMRWVHWDFVTEGHDGGLGWSLVV